MVRVKKRTGTSQTEKIKWLRDKKILIRPKKPSRSTINRLYSYYHRNPLSTPLYEAYGLKKRISKRVADYGGKYELQTPRGKIEVGEYVRRRSQRMADKTKRQVSARTSLKTGIYRKYVDRMQDYLSYRFYITCNEATLNRAVKYVEKNVLPIIRKDLRIVINNFIEFYHVPLIGSIAVFESYDFPQEEGASYQRVAFTRVYRGREKEYLDFFMHDLMESIRNGFLTCLQYERMSIVLKKIEIVITSDRRATAYEKLRV